MRCCIRARRTGELSVSALVLCYTLFRFGIQAFMSVHAACPFGSVASVHAWERIGMSGEVSYFLCECVRSVTGAAIRHIALRLLKLAAFRYVDDYFGPERCVCVLCLLFTMFCVFFGQARNNATCYVLLRSFGQAAPR